MNPFWGFLGPLQAYFCAAFDQCFEVCLTPSWIPSFEPPGFILVQPGALLIVDQIGREACFLQCFRKVQPHLASAIKIVQCLLRIVFYNTFEPVQPSSNSPEMSPEGLISVICMIYAMCWRFRGRRRGPKKVL